MITPAYHSALALCFGLLLASTTAAQERIPFDWPRESGSWIYNEFPEAVIEPGQIYEGVAIEPDGVAHYAGWELFYDRPPGVEGAQLEIYRSPDRRFFAIGDRRDTGEIVQVAIVDTHADPGPDAITLNGGVVMGPMVSPMRPQAEVRIQPGIAFSPDSEVALARAYISLEGLPPKEALVWTHMSTGQIGESLGNFDEGGNFQTDIARIRSSTAGGGEVTITFKHRDCANPCSEAVAEHQLPAELLREITYRMPLPVPMAVESRLDAAQPQASNLAETDAHRTSDDANSAGAVGISMPDELSGQSEILGEARENSTHLNQRVGAAGEFAAPQGTMWVQVASRRSLEDARTLARRFTGQQPMGWDPYVRIFRAANGWYAITATILMEHEYETDGLEWLINNQGLPSDSLMTRGDNFVEEVSVEDNSLPPLAFTHTEIIRESWKLVRSWRDEQPIYDRVRLVPAGQQVIVWGGPRHRGDCFISPNEPVLIKCADLSAFAGTADPIASTSVDADHGRDSSLPSTDALFGPRSVSSEDSLLLENGLWQGRGLGEIIRIKAGSEHDLIRFEQDGTILFLDQRLWSQPATWVSDSSVEISKSTDGSMAVIQHHIRERGSKRMAVVDLNENSIIADDILSRSSTIAIEDYESSGPDYVESYGFVTWSPDLLLLATTTDLIEPVAYNTLFYSIQTGDVAWPLRVDLTSGMRPVANLLGVETIDGEFIRFEYREERCLDPDCFTLEWINATHEIKFSAFKEFPKLSQALAEGITQRKPGEVTAGTIGLETEVEPATTLLDPLASMHLTAGFFSPEYRASQNRQHLGADYGAPVGTQVRSPVTGTAVSNNTPHTGDGNLKRVIIRDAATGYQHVLGHIDSDLDEGAPVQQGDTVGSIVAAGTGPHLHWGINRTGVSDAMGHGWGWGRAHANATQEEAEARDWADPERYRAEVAEAHTPVSDASSTDDKAAPESPGAGTAALEDLRLAAGFLDPAYADRHDSQLLGLDLRGDAGRAVRAPISGMIMGNRTGADVPTDEKWLILRDPKTGQEHVFGHILSALEPGQEVNEGDPIGEIAEGGRVHWGINRLGIWQAIDSATGWGWGHGPEGATRSDVTARGWTTPETLHGRNLLDQVVNDQSEDIDELMSSVSGFRARVHGHQNFREFVTDLHTVYSVAKNITNLQNANALFLSSLTPGIAAQAELARAQQGAGLFLAGYITKFLVKDIYARAATDPGNAPRIVRIVPEAVAIASIEAAFNVGGAVLTGGASTIIGQTISTTTNIVDAVIAYFELDRQTDELVAITMQQTSDMLRHFHVDPATEEIVLRQLEATNIISQEMLSGWLTWEPSADAAHRLAIIAGLARIKILEGAPPQLLVDVLGAAELRDRISRMSGSYCFSCTPAWNLRYQIFADKVAREFSLRGWAPMAPPQLVERQDLNSTSDQEPQSSIELNLTQIERYFISALGVDSEFAIQALIDTGFYTGDDPPYAQGGRHMQWTSKVEHAFRAALEYAQHHEISYDLTSDENYYEFLRVIRNHEP